MFAVYETIIGLINLEYEDENLIGLEKVEDIKDYGIKTNFTDEIYSQLKEYFDGNRKEFNVNLKLIGTEFQKKVWKALCEIPYGETRSYREIAIEVGNKDAQRAVGMANNKNPIAIIVPCHRVIGANGKLTGYAGGLDMKQKLLDIESNNK